MNTDNEIYIPFIQQQEESNVAPQYVQIRSTNKSLVYLDTRSQYSINGDIVENDITNMVFSTVKGGGQSSSILIRNCKRITIDSVSMNLLIPNVNTWNQTYYLTYNLVDYVVTIPTGYYPTPPELIAALLAALQTATGVAWIATSAYNANTKKFTLSASTGFAFTFNNVNFSLNRSQFLLNIPKNQPYITQMVIGPIFCTYTRYIDITSVGITRYAKIRPTSNTNDNGTQIYRFYVDTDTPTIVKGITSGSGGSIFNWERLDYLPQIDMRLFDEFGNKLLVESNPDGPVPGFLLMTVGLEV